MMTATKNLPYKTPRKYIFYILYIATWYSLHCQQVLFQVAKQGENAQTSSTPPLYKPLNLLCVCAKPQGSCTRELSCFQSAFKK